MAAAQAAGAVIAAIIAGGGAQRLGGTPKGTLKVQGRRIIDRQLEVLARVFGRVLLVANDPKPWANLGIPIIPDRATGGLGPLAGIDAALGALVPPSETAVVCIAGDMPFLDPGALILLRDHAPDADAVVPWVRGHAEPLCARYSSRCAKIVHTLLASGQLETKQLLVHVNAHRLDEMRLRTLDPDLRFLDNINTPEDLARAQTR